jgi:tRNA (guanine-N1)-methyltransferase
MQVPDVLLGGNHAEIEAWRQRESLARTRSRRPDLMQGGAGQSDSPATRHSPTFF